MNIISDPIFKRDSVGNIRTWFFEVDGDKYRTTSGLLEGAKTTTAYTVCTPKSQETAEAQALFEAIADQTKKLERDYHRSVDDIDTPLMFKPMLAQAYETVSFPCFAQPKLDGVRCIATAKGLFSRQGKRFLGVPHIEEALAPAFTNDPGLILDGELYNHDFKDDFNQIVSMVKKQNPTAGQLAKSAELIQYHVYDFPSVHGTFSARQNHLAALVFEEMTNSPIKIVQTRVAVDQAHLDGLYLNWMEAGYEGQMVRLNGPYENKRSKNLLKRKEFQDAEYPVSQIGEGLGDWAGYAKWVEFILPGDKRTESGERPKAGIKGTKAFTKELLARRDSVKTTKIKFFNLTPAGIPRFPVAIDFDRVD
ncbi:hypothetical protein [Mesorhizobium sp. STM 4661]|uniref:ATP-dependent DNA ligase n=1 Tax=Mesorhizobium sp. STM 4661 TaxID=1297570 RepID=UPI0002BF63CE|nr:hypothetical protein [Mesorhizobium sp. STM 4661]CCV12893.1 hypothetical protein MESS4_510060 [Mesorhizobium sp. STM 4661]